MRKSLLIALSTAMILAMPLNSRAETIQAEDLTVKEIIDSLYEHEPQSEVRECALKSSLILTGESECIWDDGYIAIGSYFDQHVLDYSWTSVPLGRDDLLVKDYADGSYGLLMGPENTPTEENAAYNRQCLNLLYNTVQELKSATAGMDAENTAAYIFNWLSDHLSVISHQDCRTATRLKEGYGDCDGLSGVYYMFAINCGLEIRPVHGRVCGYNHAWTEVLINGEWKIVDMTFKTCLQPISGEYADACREGCLAE